jgi:hypothetical protein
MTPPHNNGDGRAPTLAISYTAIGGQERRVVVALDTTGAWSVYDVPTIAGSCKQGAVVQHLDGAEDGLVQAVAIAIEYVAGQHAYRSGNRAEHALPNPLKSHPEEVSLAKINRDCGRAAEYASHHTEADWLQRMKESSEPVGKEHTAIAA